MLVASAVTLHIISLQQDSIAIFLPSKSSMNAISFSTIHLQDKISLELHKQQTTLLSHMLFSSSNVQFAKTNTFCQLLAITMHNVDEDTILKP
jgi:CRISPR/Cas system endoribonuclease Cas6 (RAMP superfamily)